MCVWPSSTDMVCCCAGQVAAVMCTMWIAVLMKCRPQSVTQQWKVHTPVCVTRDADYKCLVTYGNYCFDIAVWINTMFFWPVKKSCFSQRTCFKAGSGQEQMTKSNPVNKN